MTWPKEVRRIGTGRQKEPNFVAVFRIVIILLDPLADLGGGHTDDRIAVCVVVCGAFENFNAENAFLELIGLAFQCARDDES